MGSPFFKPHSLFRCFIHFVSFGWYFKRWLFLPIKLHQEVMEIEISNVDCVRDAAVIAGAPIKTSTHHDKQ